MALPTFVEVPADASPDERREIGRSARKAAPRSSFADWAPAADRPDPVAILERQAKTRVPELVPLRHRRMLASAFTFYRGGAAIMAADLGGTPSSGFRAQLCGDAHLSNFGGFAAPDRRMVFDCNDFDETLPGPWEWDVKRLAASFEIGGARPRVRQEGSPEDRRDRCRASYRLDDEAHGRAQQPRPLVRCGSTSPTAIAECSGDSHRRRGPPDPRPQHREGAGRRTGCARSPS